MKLTCEDHDQLAIIKIQGELVGDHADELFKEIQERLNRQVRDFVFDLSDMDFIDSHGLEVILDVQEQTAEQLGQVRLAALAGNINEILRITRLASRIECHETVEGAIKSLRI